MPTHLHSPPRQACQWHQPHHGRQGPCIPVAHMTEYLLQTPEHNELNSGGQHWWPHSRGRRLTWQPKVMPADVLA